MIVHEIIYQISSRLPFTPVPVQQKAIEMFAAFLTCGNARSVMVLRGSAGSGKTTIAGAIVKTLTGLKQKVVLLAPTGRAAKVFGLHSGANAYTIHRRIYRQKAFTGQMQGFLLNDNLYKDTLFIVDEASMVPGGGGGGEAAFGSGSLLDDLVQYVYQGEGCRLMFIGDGAQLPPVGEEESPALSGRVLSGYGLEVFEAELTEVLRQGQGSGILANATTVRRMMVSGDVWELPKVCFNDFSDIANVPGGELVDTLAESYANEGQDETIVVTRSNKRATIYNNGIRNQILDREELLSSGDRLMVVKNNYYWTAQQQHAPIAFIANGDRVVVERVRHERELYGLHFADVWLRFPDYNDYELQATVCLDSLQTEAPALTAEQSNKLFEGVMEDYADLPTKAERMKRIKNDPYYNAIQVKYAYAVTCHKAQGGQWRHVYVDQGYMTEDMLSPDYLHWLYTAFTRATEKLYLVNWPKEQTTEHINI